MGASIGWRGEQASVVARWGVWCVPSETVDAPVVVRTVVGLWQVEMSPMFVAIVDGVWSVPLGMQILMPCMRSV